MWIAVRLPSHPYHHPVDIGHMVAQIEIRHRFSNMDLHSLRLTWL